MLRKLQELKNKERGFTIIEVLIVLAIAALILVIVLVAIPQLQRNQRNTARKSVVGRVSTEISNSAGNNNGQIPTDADELEAIQTRYLTNVDINEPTTGDPMSINYINSSPVAGIPGTGGAMPLADIGSISYKDGMRCDGESLLTGTARQYAIWSQQEGGAIICIDNG